MLIKNKIMKKYSVILLVTALIALIACDKDRDFEEFAKPELFTSALGSITAETIQNPIPIAVNDFSSIADVSQGVTSRLWTIDEGMSFLSDDFTPADSLNLRSFIVPGSTISNTNAFFLFQEPGLKEVNLRQTFNQEVSYLGQTATQQGNEWVSETTFIYNVFDDLNPEAIIYDETGVNEIGRLNADQDPNRDDTSGFTTITIEAGTTLTFTDATTIGNPDSRIWEFTEGTPETSIDESVVVSYNRLGEFLVDITSTREQRGQALRATQRTKTLPYIIEVVPSSQPFVISEARAIDDGGTLGDGTTVIEFGVNGELEDFTGVEGDFTINAVNTGFNQNISVNSASVSTSDPTVIRLILANPIYNTDTVTLSYSAVTPINSVDTRTLNAFNNEFVEPLEINVLQPASNPSFENASSNERHGFSQGYNLFVGGGGNQLSNARNSDGTSQITRSTEQSSDGSASMKFDAEMPLIAGFLSYSNTIISNSSIPAGDYILSYDIYVEAGSMFNGIFSKVTGGNPQTAVMPFNTPGTEQWFTVQRNFTMSGALTGNIVFNFRNNDNSGITGRQTFYMDNIRILLVEKRT
jgi:hypothetical protein